MRLVLIYFEVLLYLDRKLRSLLLLVRFKLVHLWLVCPLDLPVFQLLAVAGAPYDTLEEVIGKRDCNGLGSLTDFGVKYRELEVVYPCISSLIILLF